jgi:hypothetical protein
MLSSILNDLSELFYHQTSQVDQLGETAFLVVVGICISLLEQNWDNNVALYLIVVLKLTTLRQVFYNCCNVLKCLNIFLYLFANKARS